MFKTGDRVKYKDDYDNLVLKVLMVEGKYVWLKELNGSNSPFTELSSSLVLDTIEIGDTVRVIGGSGVKYPVIGVHEDVLWVLSNNNKTRFNFSVSQVEKV